MKKYSYLLLLFLLLSFTSCLKSNLEDLPEFELNDISTVQRVEYRFISDEISTASGQKITKYVTLNHNATIDKEKKNISIKVTVPEAKDKTFPPTERDKCSTKEIVVIVSLSTAARITPVGNAPKLGVPGDWSKPNKYTVTAANGNKVEWTITISEFNK